MDRNCPGTLRSTTASAGPAPTPAAAPVTHTILEKEVQVDEAQATPARDSTLSKGAPWSSEPSEKKSPRIVTLVPPLTDLVEKRTGI